jgi:hypothetical protein
MQKNRQAQGGYTLLLAALVSSAVLTIGVSIFQLVSKQILLSSLGRDSQFAFYAADTAAECALYWDLRHDFFATSTPASVLPPNPQCDGQTFSESGRTGTFPYTISFTFEPQGKCAHVFVSKKINSSTGVIQTTIHADGFSTSCANERASARTLQRSVELHY